MKRVLLIFSIVAFVLTIAACGSGSSSGDSSSSSSSSGGETQTSQSLSSLCGSILDAVSISNPVPEGGAQFVTVTANRPDAVIITLQDGDQAGGQQVVKLHGVTQAEESGFRFDNGVSTLQQLTSGGAYYVPAGAEGECPTTFANGVQGVLGHIYSLAGANVAEELLAIGSVVPTIDGCAGDLLTGCYASIPVQVPVSPLTISRFIWKPVSERDGNLVVLVDPFDITIEVRGAVTETLVDFGPSNGFGTTSRSNRTGAAFGSAEVFFFDSQGRQVLVAGGAESVTIPNGASRVEF